MKYFWQLPQNILGLVLILIFRGKYQYDYNDRKVYYVSGDFAMSLGMYILVSRKWMANYNENYLEAIDRLLAHEYGHCRQSMYLGWLYLIVVGIPSFAMNRISVHNRNFSKNYYNRWPENWADKLGGVQR